MSAGPLSQLFGHKRPIHPDLAAVNQAVSAIDQDLPLDRFEFVVLDTELTGLDRRKDEIISIGAVKVRGLQIIAGETFHSYIRPSSSLPRTSTLVHRITPQLLLNAPAPLPVLRGFLNFCGTALLVGHHIDLDAGFLNRAFRTSFGAPLRSPCLDTLRLAKAYQVMGWEQYHDRYDLGVSYTLSDLAKRYGLPLFPAHDALQDALQAAYLFLFLVKKIRRHGYTTLKELFSAGRLAREIF